MTYVEEYECPYCGAKGVTKEEINRHITNSHPMQHGFQNKPLKIVRHRVEPKWEDESPPRRLYERRKQW